MGRHRARSSAEAEAERLQDLLSVERAFWSRGLSLLAGIDEVGRGPLAGPVVAAAVVLPAGVAIAGIDDSKRLTPDRRDRLAAEVRSRALAVGCGAASAREIDRLNIRRATALAMQRAVARLSLIPEHLLVDGLPVPELAPARQTAFVGGDARVHAIACASVVAKVLRDELMRRLGARYPVYGWERNKGYGTAEHRAALLHHGPAPHHRFSFAPVRDCGGPNRDPDSIPC